MVFQFSVMFLVELKWDAFRNERVLCTKTETMELLVSDFFVSCTRLTPELAEEWDGLNYDEAARLKPELEYGF